MPSFLFLRLRVVGKVPTCLTNTSLLTLSATRRRRHVFRLSRAPARCTRPSATFVRHNYRSSRCEQRNWLCVCCVNVCASEFPEMRDRLAVMFFFFTSVFFCLFPLDFGRARGRMMVVRVVRMIAVIWFVCAFRRASTPNSHSWPHSIPIHRSFLCPSTPRSWRSTPVPRRLSELRIACWRDLRPALPEWMDKRGGSGAHRVPGRRHLDVVV